MNAKLRVLAQSLISELNGLGEAKDMESSEAEWWRQLDWKSPDLKTLFTSLGDETRELIIEAGLVKEVKETSVEDTKGKEIEEDAGPRTEAERAKAHFELSDETWDALSEEEKQEYIDKLPPRGSATESVDDDAELDEIPLDDTSAEEDEDCLDCDENKQDEASMEDIIVEEEPKAEIDVKELLKRSRKAIKKMTHPF